MIYDITQHPLLSEEGLLLTPDQLEAQALVAERVLGLRGTAYTGADATDAAAAVALQVSLQVAKDPESYVAQTVTRGSRSVSYREGVAVHPLAVTLVEELAGAAAEATGGAYSTIQSFR